MNIQKLLKKLDKNSFQCKKQLFTAQGAYKLKTSESIGTLNSLADQNQRSFVINDAITPQSKKLGNQALSANSKLDQQLSNIEKMKNLYESRQIKNRGRTKSIQRNSASGQKSFQKHLLKPSNTPSFNKIQKAKIQKQQDSACKNLYTEQMLQNSQISRVSQISNKPANQKPNKNNIYQFPDSSLQVLDHEQQPYEEQPTYNQQSLSQIASLSQDLLQNVNAINLQKKNIENGDKIWQREIKNEYKIKQRAQKYNNQQSYHYNCVSRSQLELFMSGLQNKIDQLTSKVNQLEKQNKQIKSYQFTLKSQNQQLHHALQESNNQKEKAQMQYKKQQQEKQQLQVLLKDVLYQRQREKLQNSKQNTYRQNQKNERKYNNYLYNQTQVTSEIKQPHNSIGISQNRQSESKMKVQNLLHKLQIKVDRA